MPLLELDIHPKLVQYIKLAATEMGIGSEYVRAPRLPLVGEERENNFKNHTGWHCNEAIAFINNFTHDDQMMRHSKKLIKHSFNQMLHFPGMLKLL